jgi:hypothetical protein
MAATRTDLESSLFGDLAFEEKAERFATDGSHMVAYITKERNLRAEDDAGDAEENGEEGEACQTKIRFALSCKADFQCWSWV